MSERELVRTEFYNDFLKLRTSSIRLAASSPKESSLRSYITVMRPRAAGEFGEVEVTLMKQLSQHLETTLRVHQRISGLETRLSGMAEAMNHLSQGVILADAEGRRPMEWDIRNGVIIRKARVHGLPTPISDVLVPLLAATSEGPG